MATTYDWKSCQGVSSGLEYEVMDRLVAEHRQALGRELACLEIGSYRGQSTVLLAQYGTVIAIDLWANIHDGMANIEQAGQDSFAEFMAAMTRFGLIAEQRVFPILGTSAFLEHLTPMAFDVIYVDAAHRYDPVKLDIRHTERHLAESGLYLFHDYKRPGDQPTLGVNRAVDELLAEGKYRIQEHFGGMLCLRRKGEGIDG